MTQVELQAWVTKLDAMFAQHHEDSGYTFPRDRVGYSMGRKYARVFWERQGGGKSVYCFVRISDGAILRPDSWKRPAKHERGNIRGENPLAGCNAYGVAYLR